MSEASPMVRGEKVLIRFLLAQAELTELVDGRVYSDAPNTPTFPMVLVAHIGGRMIGEGRPYRNEINLFQITATGRRADAHQVAETCRWLIANRLTTTPLSDETRHAVLIGDPTFGGIRETSDTSFEPAKPTAHFDVTFALRPGDLIS